MAVTKNGPPTAPAQPAAPDQQPPGGGAPRSRLPDLVPIAAPTPRKLDLSRAALPAVGDLRPVQRLGVREVKGAGNWFTPNLDCAFWVRAIAFKPPGSFDAQYQIVAGSALEDPRVARLTHLTAFIAAYAWSTTEVVLLPQKLSSHGQRVVADLRTLQHEFPNFKVFKLWDEAKHRHVVYRESLSPGEAALMSGVEWPDLAAFTEALELTAYHSVEDLRAVNDDVRAMLGAREVG